jgi:hypothetical protein
MGSKEIGTPQLKCHYYSSLRMDAVYTSTRLLGIRQCVEAVDIINMLDIVFANFTNLKLLPADSGLVTVSISCCLMLIII